MHKVAFELTGTKELSEEEGEMVLLVVTFGHELYTTTAISHGDCPPVFTDQDGHDDILARFAIDKVERASSDEEAASRQLTAVNVTEREVVTADGG